MNIWGLLGLGDSEASTSSVLDGLADGDAQELGEELGVFGTLAGLIHDRVAAKVGRLIHLRTRRFNDRVADHLDPGELGDDLRVFSGAEDARGEGRGGIVVDRGLVDVVEVVVSSRFSVKNMSIVGLIGGLYGAPKLYQVARHQLEVEERAGREAVVEEVENGDVAHGRANRADYRCLARIELKKSSAWMRLDKSRHTTADGYLVDVRERAREAGLDEVNGQVG